MQKSINNRIVDSNSVVRFYLNGDLIELEGVGARDTLLDYLRLNKSLMGSKEGCGEGDCGACTVLVGRVQSGSLEYKTMNSCICLMPTLNASHIVTVENLRALDGTLHPVQRAMVNSHGSQCGFCTPGIVMSLYGAWLQLIEPTYGNIEKSLQGNLCRCTGYGPIIEAAQSISTYGSLSEDKLLQEQPTMKNNLIDLELRQSSIGTCESSKFIVPKSLQSFSKFFLEHEDATLVAGATDVGLWITKHLATINPVIFIGNLKELKNIEVNKDQINLGSCVTYSQCQPILSKHFPTVNEYFFRIAGDQIRNVGTIGGNIGNASPIGDLAPLFIGLSGTITLRRGEDRRIIAVEDFFVDYNVQNIVKSEFIEKIHIPLNENLFLFTYKISKRRDEDISTVSAIFSFEVLDEKLFNVRLVFGGMGPIPKRAKHTEDILNGNFFDTSIVKLAQLALESDFQPISDMRATKNYRMQVAKNLIQKCQLEYNSNERIKVNRDV
ncbi:MAG: xanthine dehydrogenase small subunit [Paracoccaceae bacterium]|nr:xanthine dehydrogenase small subunit [Paracoccaceae bacterium]